MEGLSNLILEFIRTMVLPLIRKTVMEAVKEELANHVTGIHEQQEEYYTVKEAAAYLKISVSKVQKMTANKEIPTNGPTKPLYIKKSVLDAYLSQPRTSSKDQIRTEIDHLLANRKK